MWCAPAKLTEIGDFGQAPARRRCPSTAQAARALFQASGSAEPVGGPSERRGGGRPCFRHRRRQPVTLRSAALYRKPPRRPRSTHRTRYRSIGRTRSAARHMHGRGSRGRLLRGATRRRSSAGTSLNPRRCRCGFGKPSRHHRMAWRCSVRPERHSGARSLPSARRTCGTRARLPR